MPLDISLGYLASLQMNQLLTVLSRRTPLYTSWTFWQVSKWDL